ncbi:MAG TPA: Uma2 family endonuclease [Polyangiaceae bacterium]
MTAPAPRLATYDDLLQLPDNVVGEIVNGQLVTSPRPGPAHAVTAMGLSISVGSPFYFGNGGPGGWVILGEPELHLGSDILVPDLAGWRLERMPNRPSEAYFTLAPDWVCEILSPSTARFDRVEKMPIYAQNQVPFLWLVEPSARTLEAYALEGARWILLGAHGGDQVVKVVPFEAVAIELGRLWG